MFPRSFFSENAGEGEREAALEGETGKPGPIGSFLASLGGLFRQGGEEEAVSESGLSPAGAPPAPKTGGTRAESEWRAYHQALDSAWRAFHLGEEGAGIMNALDSGLGQIFDASRSEDREKAERLNRRLGAGLGATAEKEEDVPRLIHQAWLNGELYVEGDESETPEREEETNTGEEGNKEGTPSGTPPAAPPAPESEPKITDEEGMRMGRELFGTP